MTPGSGLGLTLKEVRGKSYFKPELCFKKGMEWGFSHCSSAWDSVFSTQAGLGSIPGQGNWISHAATAPGTVKYKRK